MARRQPPAARFDCHPDPCWRLACRALYGAALAAVAFSLLSQAGWVPGVVRAGGVLLALLSPWLWPLSPLPVFGLRWDGQAWWLSPPSPEVARRIRPEVVLDLGAWMLLRLRAEPSRRLPVYLALRQRDQDFAWAQLRVLLWLARVEVEPGDTRPPM